MVYSRKYQQVKTQPHFSYNPKTEKCSDKTNTNKFEKSKKSSILDNIFTTRRIRKITVRPLRKSGLHLFKLWLDIENWTQVKEASTPNHKANILHNLLQTKIDEYLPLKTIKVADDVQPWCNAEVKIIKRLKGREYRKHRTSNKWKNLEEKYQAVKSKAKETYYANMIHDLKDSKPGHWYSKLKADVLK